MWQKLGIYLYNILSSDVNMRVHGVPAGVVDTRYAKTDKLLHFIIL